MHRCQPLGTSPDLQPGSSPEGRLPASLRTLSPMTIAERTARGRLAWRLQLSNHAGRRAAVRTAQRLSRRALREEVALLSTVAPLLGTLGSPSYKRGHLIE